MRKEKFNHGWVFHKGGGSSLEALAGGGAANEQPVTLPYDASVGMTRNPDEPGGSGNGFFREECYNYTKTFSLNPEDADKNIWLEFEGVYQNAFVYINGGKMPLRIRQFLY